MLRPMSYLISASLGPVRLVLTARLYARRLSGHLRVLGRVRHLALPVALVPGVPLERCTDGRRRRLLQGRPDIAALREPRRHGPYREVVRMRVGQLDPRQRCGDPGLGRIEYADAMRRSRAIWLMSTKILRPRSSFH